MAHAPETPERYVCLSCQAVYAGSVSESDGTHHFSPPDHCATCDDAEFVEIESYVRHSLAASN